MTTLCPSEIRRDLYRTGRKHCSQCKRWRLVVDFGRHPDKSRRDRGILAPHCHRCRAAYFREYRKRPHVREYERIRAEALRRQAGAKRRRPGVVKPPKGHDERMRLPAGPFARWLLENRPAENRKAWYRARGIDENYAHYIITGAWKAVHIDIVDRAVDPATLNELYPVE